MNTTDWPTAEFQAHRAHLRAVAYRMLGSLTEADDAVQETWLRLTPADADDVRNCARWLTTVVSRVCLDMLRARRARREDPLDVHVPDPVVTAAADDPEEQAVLADSVGLALLVVLDTLSPAERLAFVLHDIFAIPFSRSARSWTVPRPPPSNWPAAPGNGSAAHDPPTAAASGRRPGNAADPPSNEIADAFLAASAGGTSKGCLPFSTRKWCSAPTPAQARSALRGWSAAPGGGRPGAALRPPGAIRPTGTCQRRPGILRRAHGQPLAVIGVTIRADKITEIDILADPERLSQLDLTGLIDT